MVLSIYRQKAWTIPARAQGCLTRHQKATNAMQMTPRSTRNIYPCSNCRSFFSSPPQKFTINRTLPHSQSDLFQIVSDIGSYSNFVPFCIASNVTKSQGSLPTQADLKVGFKSYEETFSSHVRCSPPEKVEAVATNNALFERLATTWRLQQLPSMTACRVHLDIEYKFANPVYGALSNAVLPKVADQIIAAFENHAKQRLAAVEPEEESSHPTAESLKPTDPVR